MRLIDPLIAMIVASGLLLAGGAPLRADTYRVAAWPQDIGKVPCDAWKKNADGSWTQVALIKNGSTSITGNIFNANSGEANMLNAKCRR